MGHEPWLEEDGGRFVMLYIRVGKSLVETNSFDLPTDFGLRSLYMTPSPHKVAFRLHPDSLGIDQACEVVALGSTALLVRGMFGAGNKTESQQWAEERAPPSQGNSSSSNSS